MEDKIEKLYNKAEVPWKKYPCAPTLSYKQQIEILKVAIKGRWLEFAKHFNSGYYIGRVDLKKHVTCKTFEESLAGIMCLLWSEISETTREEVREILKIESEGIQ